MTTGYLLATGPILSKMARRKIFHFYNFFLIHIHVLMLCIDFELNHIKFRFFMNFQSCSKCHVHFLYMIILKCHVHDFSQFLKMVITSKIEVRITSNFLHSIRTSKNVIKIGGDFEAIFWKKTMGYI